MLLLEPTVKKRLGTIKFPVVFKDPEIFNFSEFFSILKNMTNPSKGKNLEKSK